MARRVTLAKTSCPRLFGVIPRERLFALLDANAGRPLVWVSGPPGSGKTSLLASYLLERGAPTLWYQVDAGDADPASLFHYLTLAVPARTQSAAQALPRFTPEHSADPAPFARLFFRELFAKLPAGAVVVFDNAQEAMSDGPLEAVLREACAQVPGESSIIVISRSDPPASLSAFMANGAMTVLGWSDLQLSLEEVRAIALNRDVTDVRTVDALFQQSQGWAAGVTLMLERRARASLCDDVLLHQPRDAVFDYFATLLLDSAPESTRQILLSVAFLPYVTGSMATVLSGRDDAAAVLEQLYRRHLFTDRRSGDEPIYQFHALFREFLKARAHVAISDVNALMVRSARELESHGDAAAAVDLYLAASSWEVAVDSVLREAGALLVSGRRQTLVRWIGALPRSEALKSPRLLYWLGSAQVQTEPQAAIRTLREALDCFDASRDREGTILCLTALLNAAFIGFIALDAMEGWLDRLLQEMDNEVVFSSPDEELRVWGVLCSALFWIRPWHPWTESAAAKVEALLPYGRDPTLALTAAARALATTTFNGQFDCGDRVAAATRHLVDAPAASPTEAAWWLVNAGFLRFFEARYDESLDLMHQADRIADGNGIRKSFVMAVFHRCAVEFRVLGWGVASQTLADMEALLPQARYPMAEAMLYLLKARRAYAFGRHAEAAELAEIAEVATLRIGSRYQEMLFGLIVADLLLGDGRIARASVLLARSRSLIQRAPAFDCWRGALAFIEAYGALAAGNRDAATHALRSALALAKDGKRRYYLRHFECAMPALFSLALEQGIEVAFVRDLIAMFRLKPPQPCPANWPWPVRIRTLGTFQVEVDGSPLEFSRKLPRKTLLLLKAIVAGFMMSCLPDRRAASNLRATWRRLWTPRLARPSCRYAEHTGRAAGSPPVWTETRAGRPSLRCHPPTTLPQPRRKRRLPVAREHQLIHRPSHRHVQQPRFVLRIPLLVGHEVNPWDRHHRKLQPLAAVHRHDLDAVLPRRETAAAPIFLQPLEGNAGRPQGSH
jgi:ATP/maltotriose-dependent transcriptional regulator MalT